MVSRESYQTWFLLALKMVLMCPYKFMHPSFGGREWGCRRCVKSWRCGRLSTWELVLGSLARSCWGSCDETHFTACISGGKSEYVWIQNDLWYCVFHIFAMDSPNDSPVDTMAHSNWWFLYVCWDWISMTRPGFFGQFLPQTTCGGTEALFGHLQRNKNDLPEPG